MSFWTVDLSQYAPHPFAHRPGPSSDTRSWEERVKDHQTYLAFRATLDPVALKESENTQWKALGDVLVFLGGIVGVPVGIVALLIIGVSLFKIACLIPLPILILLLFCYARR